VGGEKFGGRIEDFVAGGGPRAGGLLVARASRSG
jgi:hypothetical protein